MLAAALLTTAVPAPAAKADPTLGTSRTKLDASVSCPTRFVRLDHDPVLLVHGTAVLPEENWGWNYASILPDMGFDVCTVRLPQRALGDIQVSAEYVVNAIRTVAGASGRRVDVVGHSQGGMLPRWVLKFWPGLRRLVDDYVALAPPHHGAYGADLLCPSTCAPAAQQMKTTAEFMKALNHGDPSLGAVAWTNIYSLFDELVQPVYPESTAAVDGATNVLVQDLCPGRPLHHMGFVHDAAVFALTMDALTHRGPADVRRFDAAVCAEANAPGVTPVAAVAGNVYGYGNAYMAFGSHEAGEEPPVRAYARPR